MKIHNDVAKFLETKEYHFLLKCRLKANEVFPVFDSHLRIKKTEETRRLIEQSWQKEKDGALISGRPFFDSPGYFLSKWEFDSKNGFLKLVFGQTSFKEFFGTYKTNPEIFVKFGREFISYALAVCGIIVTLDGKLVFALRSDKVLGAKNFIAPIGGFLDKARRLSGQYIFNKFNEEIVEELGVPKKDIAETILIGIVSKNELGGLPRFVFYSTINARSGELLQIFKQKKNFENIKLLFVDVTSPAIKGFLETKQKVYWTTKACLLRFLENKFLTEFLKRFRISLKSQ